MFLSWVSSVSFSGARMVAATFQPCSAKYFAEALPKPELVPVMKTVLPISRSPSLDQWACPANPQLFPRGCSVNALRNRAVPVRDGLHWCPRSADDAAERYRSTRPPCHGGATRVGARKGGPRTAGSGAKKQSHRSDLNRRPLDYESRALPLSYGGAVIQQ